MRKWLLVIDDENWFRVFEESSQAFMHIQIVLNILCQSFAHTLALTTTIARYIYLDLYMYEMKTAIGVF